MTAPDTVSAQDVLDAISRIALAEQAARGSSVTVNRFDVALLLSTLKTLLAMAQRAAR